MTLEEKRNESIIRREYIRENFGKLSTILIAKNLKVHRWTVDNWIRKLGLRPLRKNAQNKKKVKDKYFNINSRDCWFTGKF